MAGPDVLRGLRSDTGPWPFPVCLVVGRSLVCRLSVGGWWGERAFVNPSEIEGSILRVLTFSCAGVLMKASVLQRAVSDSKLFSHCSWVVLVFFHLPHALAAPGGCVPWASSCSPLPCPRPRPMRSLPQGLEPHC